MEDVLHTTKSARIVIREIIVKLLVKPAKPNQLNYIIVAESSTSESESEDEREFFIG